MIPYGTICYGPMELPNRDERSQMSTSAQPIIDAPSARAARNRWIALVVLCVGMLMIVLDQTIVNVALPSIQSDLGFSQSTLAWVVNAYLIPFGGLLLLAGRLGDLVGRKRVFLTGLGVFTGASLLCGLADSQAMLIGARFVQGLGGALTSAVILGMVVTLFTEPSERARAIGVYSFVASARASIGLLLGGVLTEAISWHWIFFVNLPIGLVTYFLGRSLITENEGLARGERIDWLGSILITASSIALIYALIKIPEWGWTGDRTLALAGVAAALFAGFVTLESRIANPI